ncbi:MAG TPA: AtpZ/AtpI family protein [Gemmatimonadaceae bacterium]|nr:AtpZ/AtpI family protein [Gemmatimonadaceae bacterium]
MTTPKNEGGHGAEYAGLGLQFALSILLFLYVGQWLDRRLGTEPWLMIAGVFTGAGASFYSMYRKLMAIQERDERIARERREAAGRQAADDAGKGA